MRLQKILLLTLLGVFHLSLIAQNGLILVKPKGTKNWGFVNLEGNFVINAQYRKISSFSPDGFAPVIESSAAFINNKGEKLKVEFKDFSLPNVFGLGIGGFSDGMARVEVNDKWGYINTTGATAIQPQFESATDFENGYAVVKINGGWAVIDKKGTQSEIKIDKLKKVREFKNGLAIFDTEEKKFGYINTEGVVVIEAKFKSVGNFSHGVAWAKNMEGKIGYIDPKGNWTLEPKYDACKDFDPVSGMARVKEVSEWYYINLKGEPLKMALDKYGDFSEGLCRAFVEGKAGFIDASGNWVIEAQFDNARDFSANYAAAKKGELWGLIDRQGNWIIEPKFADMKDVVLLR